MLIEGINKVNSSIGLGRNVIIGGDFVINPWQRNTAFTNVANGAYTADMWLYAQATTARHTVQRSSDVPTFAESDIVPTRSMIIDCTTAQVSMAAGDRVYISQRIEGYNWAQIAQKVVTLSFWVKATKTGIYTVALFNPNGLGRESCVKEYTILSSNTWEKKTITFPASPSAGTWDYTNGIGVVLHFNLAAGTNWNTPSPDVWTANGTSYLTTANQVNACDSTANDFLLNYVQLEEGAYATPFQQRSAREEMLLCQRYYEKTFADGVHPGDINAIGYTQIRTRVGIPASTPGFLDYSYEFQVRKRTAPTVTLYSTLTGAANSLATSAGGTRTGCTAGNAGENGFSFINVSNASATAIVVDGLVSFHWAADASL